MRASVLLISEYPSSYVYDNQCDDVQGVHREVHPFVVKSHGISEIVKTFSVVTDLSAREGLQVRTKMASHIRNGKLEFMVADKNEIKCAPRESGVHGCEQRRAKMYATGNLSSRLRTIMPQIVLNGDLIDYLLFNVDGGP